MDREKLEQAITQWVSEQIYGSPISRDTQAYNHLIGSVPALVEKILAIEEDRTASSEEPEDR